MSRRRLLGLAIVATYAVVGVASSQLMLCLHRDGRSQIELASFLCCETEIQPPDSCEDGCSQSQTSSCPDDQCQDYSFSLVSPQVNSTPTLSDLAIPLVEVSFYAPPASVLEEEGGVVGNASPSGDHPPESGAKAHLRTVVLRL